MVKFTEFRIGNYLLPINEWCHMDRDKPVKFDLKLISLINNNNHKWENSFNPIKITKDNIEKFGFSKLNTINTLTETYIHNKVLGLSILFYYSGQIGLFYREFGKDISVTVKYLHKMQNLVFELSDFELEINW